jgi:hypothetical protein
MSSRAQLRRSGEDVAGEDSFELEANSIRGHLGGRIDGLFRLMNHDLSIAIQLRASLDASHVVDGSASPRLVGE